MGFSLRFCFFHFSSSADIREVPRVLTIYDIDMPVPEARQAVRNLFFANSKIEDKRVVDMLVEKVCPMHSYRVLFSSLPWE